jgi:GGDEF domain-containing protein
VKVIVAQIDLPHFKEYISEEGDTEVGDATLAVVSLVVEIQGDQTKYVP